MSTIFGLSPKDVTVVDVDGSPSGRKVSCSHSRLPLFVRRLILPPSWPQEYLVWNPPYIDDKDIKQGRVSTISETSRVFRFLLERGVRAIVFCKVSEPRLRRAALDE